MSMCFLRGRPPAGVVGHQQVPPASFHLQGKDGDSGHLSRWSPSDDKQMTVLTSECRHTHLLGLYGQFADGKCAVQTYFSAGSLETKQGGVTGGKALST